MGKVSSLWSGPPTAWMSLTRDLHHVDDEVSKQGDRWLTYVSSLSDADLRSAFSYKNTSGVPLHNVRGPILTHVFNHGTHHRGQISAVITKLGQPAPAMDLLYMLNSKA